MARPSPVSTQDIGSEDASKASPVYFLTIPELAYKALSDASAKRNKTVAQLVAVAISEYLKNTEGV
jgi:hypothetical protein